MVVRGAIADVVACSVLHTASGMATGVGSARVPGVYLTVVPRVARRAVAFISEAKHNINILPTQ